jgi:hypothetical protein
MRREYRIEKENRQWCKRHEDTREIIFLGD